MSFSMAIAICCNLDIDKGKFPDEKINEAIRTIIETNDFKSTPKKALWNVMLFLRGKL